MALALRAACGRPDSSPIESVEPVPGSHICKTASLSAGFFVGTCRLSPPSAGQDREKKQDEAGAAGEQRRLRVDRRGYDRGRAIAAPMYQATASVNIL